VGHAFGGQQGGGGGRLLDAKGGEGRIGGPDLSEVLGLRLCVSDDDQLHGSGTLRAPAPRAAIRMPGYATSTTPTIPRATLEIRMSLRRPDSATLRPNVPARRPAWSARQPRR